MVNSKLSGTPRVQSCELYEINATLHAMVRASILNVCPMASAAVVDDIDCRVLTIVLAFLNKMQFYFLPMQLHAAF